MCSIYSFRMEGLEIHECSCEGKIPLDNQTAVMCKPMTSVLKVMLKFCLTIYDIASDFLQGKHSLVSFICGKFGKLYEQ